MRNRRSKESYTSVDPDKRQKQLDNLNRTKTASAKKTPFLKDARNKDLRYFLEHFYILESNKLIVLEDWQIRNIINPICSGDNEVFIFGMPKKSGKSTISAGVGIHQLFFSQAISPEVYSLATSKDQARIIFNKARKAIRRSPELRKSAKIYKDRIETPFNEGIYQVLSADEDTAEGKNPSCVLLDEGGIAKWSLWVSLLTAQGQREGTGQKPIAVITLTAGHDPASPFHKLIQRAQRGNEPDTYCFISHDNLASWINPRWLAKQRKRLSPAEYQRYHQNQWVSQSSSFVTQADINRCIDAKLSQQGLGKENLRYYVGLDVGLVRDRSVITVVHREQHKTILDSIRVFEGKPKSPVLLNDLEMELLKIYKLFNSPTFSIDVWQASQLIERLRARGCRIVESKFTSSLIQQLTSNLYNQLHNGLLRIFKDEGLIDELLSVEAIQGASGVRLDHKSGKFSDRVISLGLACLEASKEPYFEGRPKVILGAMRDGTKPDLLERTEAYLFDSYKRMPERRRVVGSNALPDDPGFDKGIYEDQFEEKQREQEAERRRRNAL